MSKHDDDSPYIVTVKDDNYDKLQMPVTDRVEPPQPQPSCNTNEDR